MVSQDEEFTITGDPSNAADAAFDSQAAGLRCGEARRLFGPLQVEALQDAVLDDAFQDS